MSDSSGMAVKQLFNLEPLLSVAIAAGAATWIVWQFLIRREAEPAAELDIDLQFLGRQDHKWLIEVAATLRNQSAVRHWYRDLRVVVRYLLPDDPISDGGAQIKYQLHCPRTIDERIAGQTREFANVMYIDPRLTFRHRYVTFVPGDVTFVWVQCSLKFPGRRNWYSWRRMTKTKNGQRLFAAPR